MGWTFKTLLAHIRALMSEADRRYEQRFEAQEKAVGAALAAADRAVVKAELAADKRFDGVNEFRQTLSDQNATFITRTEAEAAINRNTTDIAKLTARMDVSSGRGVGAQVVWGYVSGAVGLLLTVVSVIYAITR